MKCKPTTWSRECVFVCARGKDACHARVSSIVSCRIMSCRVMSKRFNDPHCTFSWKRIILQNLKDSSPLHLDAPHVSCWVEIKYAFARAIVKTNAISDFMKYIDFYTNTINQNINIYDYHYYYFSVILFASLTFVLYNLAFILIRNVGIVYPTCCFMLVTIFRGYLFSLILYFVRL